jgi:hypothetical protein
MSDHNDPTQSGALPSVSLQPVVGSEIGSMDWGACMDCKHDIRGGGCAVDPTAFKNKIMFNMDSVYCGCFESRYADRPNPSCLGTGHLVAGPQHDIVGRSESKEPK